MRRTYHYSAACARRNRKVRYRRRWQYSQKHCVSAHLGYAVHQSFFKRSTGHSRVAPNHIVAFSEILAKCLTRFVRKLGIQFFAVLAPYSVRSEIFHKKNYLRSVYVSTGVFLREVLNSRRSRLSFLIYLYCLFIFAVRRRRSPRRPRARSSF